MTDLDGNLLALGMGELDNRSEGRDVVIGPDAEVVWGDATFWNDCGSLHDSQKFEGGFILLNISLQLTEDQAVNVSRF